MTLDHLCQFGGGGWWCTWWCSCVGCVAQSYGQSGAGEMMVWVLQKATSPPFITSQEGEEEEEQSCSCFSLCTWALSQSQVGQSPPQSQVGQSQTLICLWWTCQVNRLWFSIKTNCRSTHVHPYSDKIVHLKLYDYVEVLQMDLNFWLIHDWLIDFDVLSQSCTLQRSWCVPSDQTAWTTPEAARWVYSCLPHDCSGEG
jgi:hypothetical protein